MGTNRYAYSFNDPINLRDPGGNIVGVDDAVVGLAALVGLAAAIVIDMAEDYLDDGEMNGSGPFSGGIAAGIEMAGNILSSDSGEDEEVEVVPAEEENNKGTSTKPSFVGKPGTVQEADYQDRRYGPDGRPLVDIDWDNDHEGAGRPHAHDWENGERGDARSPTEEELSWTGGRRDPETGKLND